MTSAFVNDEIETYDELIVEKSGMSADRVAQFIDLLFQYIDVVPADDSIRPSSGQTTQSAIPTLTTCSI